MGQWAKRRREGGETQVKKMGGKRKEVNEVKEGHIWEKRGGRAVPRPHLEGVSAFHNPGCYHTVPSGPGESKEKRSGDATPLVKANMDRHVQGRYKDKKGSPGTIQRSTFTASPLVLSLFFLKIW